MGNLRQRQVQRLTLLATAALELEGAATEEAGAG